MIEVCGEFVLWCVVFCVALYVCFVCEFYFWWIVGVGLR